MRSLRCSVAVHHDPVAVLAPNPPAKPLIKCHVAGHVAMPCQGHLVHAIPQSLGNGEPHQGTACARPSGAGRDCNICPMPHTVDHPTNEAPDWRVAINRHQNTLSSNIRPNTPAHIRQARQPLGTIRVSCLNSLSQQGRIAAVRRSDQNSVFPKPDIPKLICQSPRTFTLSKIPRGRACDSRSGGRAPIDLAQLCIPPYLMTYLGGPNWAEMLKSGPVEPEPVNTGGGKVEMLSTRSFAQLRGN